CEFSYLLSFSFSPFLSRRALHSFPTRRSSDLVGRSQGPLRRSLLRHPQRIRAQLQTVGDRPSGPLAARPGAPLRAHRGEHLPGRSEEHTSELQSRFDLVCRLLLEKKKSLELRN